MEGALLRRLFVPGGLRDELARARNFYMLTTGARSLGAVAADSHRSTGSTSEWCSFTPTGT